MDSRTEAAFTEFVRGRWSTLVRLGYGLTGDQRRAENLARAALAKAYASWPRVIRAGSPDVYVRRTMLNANHGRLRRRRARAPETGGQDDRSALMTALLRLPAGQRSVVLLRYWMDMTEAEVAEALGCSVGSVKSQASRALAKLRVSEDLAKDILL
jgi:RNA polymerase sigma-70 factor (sigma-E family)